MHIARKKFRLPLRTRDANGVSIQFRMQGGFPGDVNRTHPFSVTPRLIDPLFPPLTYGCALLVSTDTANSVRGVKSTDTGVTRIKGVLVRPYPTQQSSGGMTATLGAATPPTSGAADCMEYGHIMTKCQGTPTLDAAVYVWVAADSGNHKQGMFEAAASGGNTAAIANARFNGPPDSNGNVEIIVTEGF